jgi:hypothetical protein
MNTGTVGAALLLQEMKASRLIGSLVCKLDGASGWIRLGFFSEPGSLLLTRANGRVSGTMSRSVSMQLIASFRVLAAQLRWMRHQIEVAAVEGLPLQPLMFQVQKDTVSFFWEAENPWTSVRADGSPHIGGVVD